MTEDLNDHPSLQRMNELFRICRNAVQKAQEESRRMGVPNVYSYDGVIYYELPNGELNEAAPRQLFPADSAILFLGG